MNKMKKRLATVGLAAALTVGAALPVGAATDGVQTRSSADTAWSFYASDIYTWHNLDAARLKEDYSSIYFYWQTGTLRTMALKVFGLTSSSGASVNCGTSTPGAEHSYTVPGKGEYLLINYVRENGYRYARLAARGKSAGGATGLWSPDSVGSYPTLR